MHEQYEDQESDGGGEWINEPNEPVAAMKPFLDQFRISTPTSASASRHSLWSSPASPFTAPLPRESIVDIIMRIQAETNEKIEAREKM